MPIAPRKFTMMLERVDLIDELARQLAFRRGTKTRLAFLRHLRSELASHRDELVQLQRDSWDDTPELARPRRRKA